MRGIIAILLLLSVHATSFASGFEWDASSVDWSKLRQQLDPLAQAVAAHKSKNPSESRLEARFYV